MSDSAPAEPSVRQLRLVVAAEDFDEALTFYRDVLGLPEQAAYEGVGEARVVILHAGVATLELSNPAQVRMIDAVEADGRPSRHLRVAFEVADTEQTSTRLVEAGATLTAAARETPWRSINARFDAPAGLEITVFQELEALEERQRRPGFGDSLSDTPTADGGRALGARRSAERAVPELVQDPCHDHGMADPVVRETLLVQEMPAKVTSSVEVRRITLQPGVVGGAHVHNGPVFGSIERGSVVFQVEGGPARTLTVGDVFYEPADETIARWDATDEGVTFLGYFLLGDGQAPELAPLD